MAVAELVDGGAVTMGERADRLEAAREELGRLDGEIRALQAERDRVAQAWWDGCAEQRREHDARRFLALHPVPEGAWDEAGRRFDDRYVVGTVTVGRAGEDATAWTVMATVAHSALLPGGAEWCRAREVYRGTAADPDLERMLGEARVAVELAAAAQHRDQPYREFAGLLAGWEDADVLAAYGVRPRLIDRDTDVQVSLAVGLRGTEELIFTHDMAGELTEEPVPGELREAVVVPSDEAAAAAVRLRLALTPARERELVAWVLRRRPRH